MLGLRYDTVTTVGPATCRMTVKLYPQELYGLVEIVGVEGGQIRWKNQPLPDQVIEALCWRVGRVDDEPPSESTGVGGAERITLEAMWRLTQASVMSTEAVVLTEADGWHVEGSHGSALGDAIALRVNIPW